jgi:nicotinate-nucleotide adenylyltransferase
VSRLPASRKETVAFFGGSFNPPHVGHVLAVAYARSVFEVDRVFVVPVFRHPFAKELAPYDARLEMCRLALAWIPGVEVSTVERDLGGESLTLRTIEHLVSAHPDWSWRLLIGEDVVGDLPKWHRFDRIAELAPPLVLGRRGAAATEAPDAEPVGRVGEPLLPRISSTEVREALRSGALDGVRDRVPPPVLAFASARGLYRSAS